MESRSSGDISKVLESRPLIGIGHRALRVNENDSSFLPSVVADEKVPPCLRPAKAGLRAGRSKTFPISPLALRENRFFHTFLVIEGSMIL